MMGKDNINHSLAYGINIAAIAFYAFPIVLYTYVSCILTKMIKKVDPESHKIFKKKIVISCIIVELVMMSRVVISFYRFFYIVWLKQEVMDITMKYSYRQLTHDVFYFTEYFIIIYLIIMKVKDIGSDESA
jgi:hypothetical protein